MTTTGDAHQDGTTAPVEERMSDAARDLHVQRDPSHTYEMATTLALANVEGCHEASLSMVRGRRQGRRVENRAATGPGAALADELQSTLAEGPCLDAIAHADTIRSTSLAYDPRWPVWGPQVVERTGLQSVLSLHLFTHADGLGALNLYSRDKDGFSLEDRHDGLVLAAHIAVGVAAAEKVHDLGQALASRTVIGQATGMLIERFGLTPEVAFSVLARASSDQNTKIRVLSEELVRTGRLAGFG